MITAPLYNFATRVKSTTNVDERIFGIVPCLDVVAQAAHVQRTNHHAGLAHTKTRGMVRGGGKKPWRQKGTGRARQGTIRSPLWPGGGIVFGPQKRTIKRTMPKKMRQLAIRSLLTIRLSEGRLWLYEGLDDTITKTKSILEHLNELPKAKRILLTIPQENTTVRRALRNIPNVHVVVSSIPSVGELLTHDLIVLGNDLVEQITTNYTGQQEKPSQEDSATAKPASSASKASKQQEKAKEQPEPQDDGQTSEQTSEQINAQGAQS